MSIDTVNDLPPRVQYTASAGQTIFPYPFPVFAGADLVVIVNGVTKALSTNYTVSGAGSDTGGNVTFLVALVGGELVTIYRDMAIERDTDVQQNGPWSSVAYNDEQDKTYLILQQTEAAVKRAIRLPIDAAVADADMELPPASYANKYLSFNSAGKPTPAALSATTMTQATIGGLLYPAHSPSENGLTLPALHFMWGWVPRYGSAGDGITSDQTAFARAVTQAQGSMRWVKGQPGDTYLFTGVQSPVGALLMDMTGATIKGTTLIDLFEAETRFDLFNGKLDTFSRAITNTTVADPIIDLRVRETEFVNGANSPINIECPVRDFSVVSTRAIDNKGYNIRLGKNDFSLQAGWQSCLAAFGFYKNVTHVSNDVAAIISYAPFSRIIGNHIRDINGFTGTDTTFIYTKSPYGLVALNVCDDIDSTAGTKIIGGIKLKGTNRGTSALPNGYAATALGNVLRTAADSGNAIQVEADEQAAIANYGEGFEYGINAGSGQVDSQLVALNRLFYSGALTTGRGILWGAVEGERYQSIGNLLEGFAAGTVLTMAAGKTCKTVSIVGGQAKGLSTAQGEGIKLAGGDADSLTKVLIADTQVDNFSQGISLQQTKWAILSNTQFGALSTSTRPIFFVSCKNVVGRNVFSNEIQTTDATATTVFQIGDLADNNVLKVTMHALAKKTDMSAVGSLRRDFLFKRTGGTTTLVASGTQVNDGGNALPADALSGSVTTDRGVFRVKGIAAETWDWFVNFDFELL
jgi:hypothetical protein